MTKRQYLVTHIRQWLATQLPDIPQPKRFYLARLSELTKERGFLFAGLLKEEYQNKPLEYGVSRSSKVEMGFYVFTGCRIPNNQTDMYERIDALLERVEPVVMTIPVPKDWIETDNFQFQIHEIRLDNNEPVIIEQEDLDAFVTLHGTIVFSQKLKNP